MVIKKKQKDNFNKKMKGDIFEEFSVLYLKYIKNYNNVQRCKKGSRRYINSIK